MSFRPWAHVQKIAFPRRRPPLRCPCPGAARARPFLEVLEDRSLPSVAPLPIPGGIGPFLPGEPFQHINLPGPADAPQPIGNDPSTITNFNGFIGVAHFEGTGTDNNGNTLLWDADLRFMTGVYQGVDGKIHKGTFVEV
jgi:hypothetical protein